ncbi:SpaA isopeptide-forming pilin-related protein [Enterocloster clostridioformis]|uniref:MSCRAMM family protein n=1 Tax=Enterocloster clostridioformis TaxID=1531 RepID=UPI0026751CB1|nr:SpaA isopeptide-forming pilin-related protein [Enterocloster clostridioformis]
MKTGYFPKGRQLTAFLLAVVLSLLPILSVEFGAFTSWADGEGRGETYTYYGTQNLLKEGASFPFYGKDHNRVGLWPYGITNASDSGNSAPGYCLEPNKSMRTRTQGTFHSYDLDKDGDNLPLGLTRETAEILWYALSSSGNFEGYQERAGKVSQGHYILGQAATWAIMSGNWAGLEDFRNQMEVLIANIKDPSVAAQTRGALTQFFNQTNGAVEKGAIPGFVSKYQTNAPVHKMDKNDDGTYSISFEIDGSDWRQTELEYELPLTWSYKISGNQITFTCTDGNPDIGLVRGRFKEGSPAAQYWVKPNTFKIWYPDGWTEASATEGKQAMITMAGKEEPWEVWLQFGNNSTTVTSGRYEIPYERHEHEETFKRNYKIELNKYDSETGKPLENSDFEILEQFDFGQLDGTNLEEDQFREDSPLSEGRFGTLTVCADRITTDRQGHLEHTDLKKYDYCKTYCNGHPDPIIEYYEADGDADEEEQEEIDAKNEELEREAWEAWQQCVDWCEENCDFHSLDEGVARDALELDRDEAWDSWIHLERVYTAREIKARLGYILHDLHNDDIPVEIVTFSSSEAGGTGTVTGTYPGNKKGTGTSLVSPGADLATPSEVMVEEEAEETTEEPEIFRHEVPVVQATATPSEAEKPAKEENGKETEEQEKETEVYTEEAQEKEETEEEADLEESLEEDIGEATPNNAQRTKLELLRGGSYAEEDGEGGIWAWDGVMHDSEVPPVNQGDYLHSDTGYLFEIYDHRTEGQIHINKRDLELYSYGKTQGDGTLQGAVYGLYAYEDIIHPDGYTGTVFTAGDLVAVAATDENGDASFLVITEESDTSKQAPNLYDENIENNGNQWIGRPLLLGSYYVEEISRSEGYELSRVGINLSESNRTGTTFPISKSGTVSATDLNHRINEYDGSWNDFTVTYFDTSGYQIKVSGYPEGSKFYRVTGEEKTSEEQVITGTQRIEKRDSNGNIIYKTAKGGEYKYNLDGTVKLKFDEEGEPVYEAEPMEFTYFAVNRLNIGVAAIEREDEGDPDIEASEEIDKSYVKKQANEALLYSGYKDSLDGYPWTIIEFDGETNEQFIGEILEYCASEPFWDAYRVERVYEENGVWKAILRYGYKALSDAAIYDRAADRLVVKGTCDSGFFYAIYEADEFIRNGNRFTVGKKAVREPVKQGEPLVVEYVYPQAADTYEPGEIIMDHEGNPIPEMETVPVYETVPVFQYEEKLEEIEAEFDQYSGLYTIDIDTSDVNWETQGGSLTVTYRAQAPEQTIMVDGTQMDYGDYVRQYENASVSVFTEKEAIAEGSYIQEAVLLYPGQYQVDQDAGTGDNPIIVTQRVIKQAIKVTKDIAEDSYKDTNTYKIHRDPFTVLFGGFNNRPEAKTIPGFSFKLYLRSDLLETGFLKETEDGAYDYETFFKQYPELGELLAVEWDDPRHDVDHDLKTLHASRGGGKDDYWGQSIMLPYGVYVLVEQQPTEIPGKHYEIDKPKEVEIPFVPQIDEDGTIHDKNPSPEYFYDAKLTPEELMERYFIRFNEETHTIKAHNHDGDFLVFKYGLEPDSARDCGNETVAGYYHYKSISEDHGQQDDVYYDVYLDRDGNVADYGVTLDGVDTMTGVSTAIDRKYAKALVPWSVLDPRYGEVINDNGDIGNREPGLEKDGSFNFISFANMDFENEFYGSRIRIEKLDSETGENILHDGALFKIYAARRDVVGTGTTGVEGTGDVLFDEHGIPLYDESEQIIMRDETGAEVGIFKAYSTIRDGEVKQEDGSLSNEKQCVGYIELPQMLGAGCYVLVEQNPPEGYVRSRPIAIEVYSDLVEYYEDGDAGKKVPAVKYQYVKAIGKDGKPVMEDMHQMVVKDQPIHLEIHKVEQGDDTITYQVHGDEKQLKERGDVILYYWPNGEYAGYGYATKTYDEWSAITVSGTEEELKKMGDVRLLYQEDGTFTGRGIRYNTYVGNATLTMYQGLQVEKTGEHEYKGVTVKRNIFDSVLGITASDTGVDTDIRITEQDAQNNDIWDITEEKNPDVPLWYFDLEYDPTEYDEASGILYGLDDWGNRICMLDSETGMAYVEDEKGNIIVWPLDKNGNKIISQSVEVHRDENGKETINSDLEPVVDENGLPIYYKNGGVTMADNEWVTSAGKQAHEIARVPVGAYILEETVVPSSVGYVQTMPIGMLVNETTETQPFYLENDFTKIEISKLDMTSRKEVEGAELTLYVAHKVYDDTEKGWHLEITRDLEGNPRIQKQWISGYEYDGRGNLKLDEDNNPLKTTKPHWIDHIAPGDYILRETRTPTEAGYVTSSDVEVTILETGEVQGAVMEDDHTAVEILKTDSRTGKALDNENPAVLALYPAVLNENGEPEYDENGQIRYNPEEPFYKWTTDDGSEVRKTAHLVETEGGHSYIAYDYDIKPVPGSVQSVCYVTETGAMHFDYMPVGKYVLVEEVVPSGMKKAAPIYIPVLDVGSETRTQSFTMVNEPIMVLFLKTSMPGGKVIAGARMAVYQAAEDGSLTKHNRYDEEGNQLFITDTDGNFIYDKDGNLIPSVDYEESDLVETWISGSDGVYTEQDQKEGRIPDGFAAGDLKPHRIEALPQGIYYLVEQQTPFGYVRAEEIRFESVESSKVIEIEMVDKSIKGRLEITKTDAENPDKPLAGAAFKVTNIDKNTAIILITDSNGYVGSSYMPIGEVSADGSVSLYTFKVQEVSAPDGYLIDPAVHIFQFNVKTDRVEYLTYHYEAADRANSVEISKKDLTSKEEVPGALLEIRPVKITTDESGNEIKEEGEIFESWRSSSVPHVIKNIPAGHYVLIEREVPDGYLQSEKVYFEIRENMTAPECVDMFDEHITVEIEKLDQDTGHFLPGARLQLIEKKTGNVVREWISGVVPERFTALPAGDYEIRELESPEGYQVMEPVEITVLPTAELQTYTVRNYPIQVVIEKVDKETGEYVSGVKLELLNEVKEVVSKWVTGSEPMVFTGLQAGVYYIRETKTADGYQLLNEPVKIVVTDSAGVQTFRIENQRIEVEIEKVDGETGQALSGAKLELVRLPDGEVIRQWVSADTPEVFKGISAGRYLIREVESPDAYLNMPPMEIQVTGQEGVQKFTFQNFPIQAEIEKVDGESHESVAGVKLKLVKEDGAVVREWMTDGNPERFSKLEAGDYLVYETSEADGYQKLKEPVRITVTKDYKIQVFTIENHKIEVNIEKLDKETKEPVIGAVLQLIRNRDGALMKEWVSGVEPEHFTGLEKGFYTIKEVRAAEGYLILQEPVIIEVTNDAGVQNFEVPNQKLEVDIQKTDGEKPLPGTKLRLVRVDNQEIIRDWTSGELPEVFKGLAPGLYEIHELEPLPGYQMALPFTVEVKEGLEKQYFEMENKQIEVHVEKVDSETKEPVAGAVLQLYSNPGTISEELVEEWVTDGTVKRFAGLLAGDYEIREKSSPDGYATMKPMKFQVTDEPGIREITAVNQKIQVEISKQNGKDHKPVIGAKLQMVREADGHIVREWVSGEKPEVFKGVAPGRYVIREVEAPAGFEKMEPVMLEIKDQADNQEFTVYNYEIRHTPDNPDEDDEKPGDEYGNISKVDATTGEKIAGATITIYNPDGSIYFTGVSDQNGNVRFKKPKPGVYTFKETAGPENYYVNTTVFQFTVEENGHVVGDNTVKDYKKMPVVIQKVDMETGAGLAGAVIRIMDHAGNVVIEGTTDREGKISFLPEEPGQYQYQEVIPPENYERNPAVFTFHVFEDGSVIGDCVLKNSRHYGTITAEYQSKLGGKGEVVLKGLEDLPKTGYGEEESHHGAEMALLLLAVAVMALALRKRRLMKMGCMALLVMLLLAGNSRETYASEEVYREEQYVTTDRDEKRNDFVQDITVDGVSYHLKEVRHEILGQRPAEPSDKELITVYSDVFLEDTDEKLIPAQEIVREGCIYELQGYTKEKTVIPAHEELAEDTVLYEAVEAMDTIPENVPITVTDERTGQQTEQRVPLSGYTFSDRRWEDGFEFRAVFHEYGTPGYHLGDMIVPHNDEMPLLAGCEEELLQLLGLDKKNYEIQKMEWSGDAYQDTEGVICRDALISGRKMIADCSAVYGGSVVFEEEDGFWYVAEYLTRDFLKKQEVEYQVKATAIYTPQKTSKVPAALIGAGSILAASSGAGGIYQMKKRKIVRSIKKVRKS